jgi:hypothetical protein
MSTYSSVVRINVVLPAVENTYIFQRRIVLSGILMYIHVSCQPVTKHRTDIFLVSSYSDLSIGTLSFRGAVSVTDTLPAIIKSLPHRVSSF